MTLMKKKAFIDAAYISEGLLTYGYSLQFLRELFGMAEAVFWDLQSSEGLFFNQDT